ncbi:MAG: 50S ribosomal protein L25 [Candidatus Falkowbacteria bacterium]
MKETFSLTAQKRDVKIERPRQLRRDGQVPAVVYGLEFASQSIKLVASDLDKVIYKAGETHLVELAIEGTAPVKVLIYDVARDLVKNKLIHVDFLKVDMKEKITIEIPLHFIGEAKVVKDFGAVLSRAHDHLEVECLPDALVDFIEVDVSVLAEMGDQIHVRDISLPTGMITTLDGDDVLVSVIVPETQEEIVPIEVAPVVEPVAGKAKAE